MNEALSANKDRPETTDLSAAQVVMAAFALIAPMFSYLIAVSAFSLDTKTLGLSGLAFIYAVICIWSYRTWRRQPKSGHLNSEGKIPQGSFSDLSDAGEFFGNRLSSNDMLRLVCNRIEPMIEFDSAALLMPAEIGGELRVRDHLIRSGRQERSWIEVKIGGVAALAFLSGEPEIGDAIDLGSEGTASAIPLKHNSTIFGVLLLISENTSNRSTTDRTLLNELSAQVSPLFLGAMTRESSISNALTDPITGLPNERAFFMILENQIAESQRFRDERPLSVIAVDIKGFEELNRELGHATGDSILKFVGDVIRGSLRKMDFLARSHTDEFLLILPRIGEPGAIEVKERISQSLADKPYTIDEHQQIKILLNFGIASFWQDGDTAKQIKNHANMRKAQAKSESADNVYWFSKGYVN